MSNEQAARQGSQQRASEHSSATTTTTTREPAQRTAQATTAMWKPERILLKGVTKADLQNAPEFNWDESSTRLALQHEQPAGAQSLIARIVKHNGLPLTGGAFFVQTSVWPFDLRHL